MSRCQAPGHVRLPSAEAVGTRRYDRAVAATTPETYLADLNPAQRQADQIRLVKRCLEELERGPKRFTPRGIHSQISNAKNTLVGPVDYTERVASFYHQTVAEVYDLYQKRLFASNAVDFDDMLFLTVDVLERFPEAREKWHGSFRYILGDEYQDTNHAQYPLLQLLPQEHPHGFALPD